MNMTIERRSKMRYPLELNVRYQTLETRAPTGGSGQTVNMSSSGLLVAGQAELSEGTRLRVTVEWPSLLNGNTPLQLVTIASVVRCTESSFAVAFENYQFRTMSRKAKLQEPAQQARELPKLAAAGGGFAAAESRHPSTQSHSRGGTRSLALVPLLKA